MFFFHETGQWHDDTIGMFLFRSNREAGQS